MISKYNLKILGGPGPLSPLYLRLAQGALPPHQISRLYFQIIITFRFLLNVYILKFAFDFWWYKQV